MILLRLATTDTLENVSLFTILLTGQLDLFLGIANFLKFDSTLSVLIQAIGCLQMVWCDMSMCSALWMQQNKHFSAFVWHVQWTELAYNIFFLLLLIHYITNIPDSQELFISTNFYHFRYSKQLISKVTNFTLFLYFFIIEGHWKR